MLAAIRWRWPDEQSMLMADILANLGSFLLEKKEFRRPNKSAPFKPLAAAGWQITSGTLRLLAGFLCENQEGDMHILWLILIGFVAGIIAKFIHPGSNEPSGFILTTLLGIAGAFVATYLGQALGWYQADQGAGLIGAVVGAVIVLVVWGLFARRDATV